MAGKRRDEMHAPRRAVRIGFHVEEARSGHGALKARQIRAIAACRRTRLQRCKGRVRQARCREGTGPGVAEPLRQKVIPQ